MKDPGEFVITIQKKIRQMPLMPLERFNAMRELPLPLQLALLRRYYKITQSELAGALQLKQGYYSRLEEENSRHLLSHYMKAAKVLLSRVGLTPAGHHP